MVQKALHNCGDCGADPGKIHLEECDVQRCSYCGGQRMCCDCRYNDDVWKHNPYFARWTGLWPGVAESKFIGIDLNEFHRRDYDKIFFVNPYFNKYNGAIDPFHFFDDENFITELRAGINGTEDRLDRMRKELDEQIERRNKRLVDNL